MIGRCRDALFLVYFREPFEPMESIFNVDLADTNEAQRIYVRDGVDVRVVGVCVAIHLRGFLASTRMRVA